MNAQHLENIMLIGKVSNFQVHLIFIMSLPGLYLILTFLVFKNKLSFLLHYQEKQTDNYGIIAKKIWSKVERKKN